MTTTITPLQRVGDFLLKRDDLFEVASVRGGKARACWSMAQGAPGLVTGGSRSSPQIKIVAYIAKALGVPCRVHVPIGDLTPELRAAQAAGAIVIRHSPGHNTVIAARAREDDAIARGWRLIPFGMECPEAVQQTATQAHATFTQMRDQGATVRRVVVPVGSGMSLAGVLHGLAQASFTVPVVGVVVGADPVKRLDEWAPARWRNLCELVRTHVDDFQKSPPVTRLGDVELDPLFEAKCLEFLEPGDLLWVIGIR
jgi:1-aminocyclopropane-1-carboxylate deaminase/D-cysteine desulfhydrase-like pyridoxal-dependent ACC family enzyme